VTTLVLIIIGLWLVADVVFCLALCAAAQGRLPLPDHHSVGCSHIPEFGFHGIGKLPRLVNDAPEEEPSEAEHEPALRRAA
jgi:hypothetical protein